MTDSHIRPERITKPIQLLAAWLAGLFSINATFLFTVTRLPVDSWEMRALTVAAITNVPIFLIALFVLQTKFRPELQEDSYYSTYLSSKTNQTLTISNDGVKVVTIAQKISEIENRVAPSPDSHTTLKGLSYGVCKYLEDIEAISNKLAQTGVLSYSMFGGKEPPPFRTLAISKHLSREVLEQVLILARDLGFTDYKLYDNVLEDATEDVLFGSYGEPKFRISGGSV
ncbi:hypothetical protein [Stenotrophomonas acidaminiphila]|uniref:hypothetical protein n=1 Tax=Stenotrophomonas acidaminiphila TaxID=128780 RepID=UPI0015FC5EDA|nr:hypothetical protein [Stenotrophomonas acidaminiphila]